MYIFYLFCKSNKLLLFSLKKKTKKKARRILFCYILLTFRDLIQALFSQFLWKKVLEATIASEENKISSPLVTFLILA